MENRTINTGKYAFIKTTYNGISVLIEKSSGYYNATKICKDNGKEMFHLVQLKDYNDMILSISTTLGIPRDRLSMKITDVENDLKGTYIHPLLVNYVCQWANKAYAVKVSIMMNLINEEAKLKCSTFESQLESQKRFVETLKDKNNSLEKQVNEQTAKINKLIKSNEIIKTQNEELLSINKEQSVLIKDQSAKIDEQTTLIKGIRSDVYDLKTDFNDNFTVSNITTATAKYVYLTMISI